MRKIAITVGIVVVVIIIVLALIPLMINANSFKPRVQDELTKALGRPVTIGDLSASIYSGGIKAKNITIADDPEFEQQPFIQAQLLTIGVDIAPLIFSKKLNIHSLELQSPEVHLLQAKNGRWNFSSLGGQKDTKSGRPGASTSSGDQISVDKLKIEGGNVQVGVVGGAIRKYTDVALTASNLSYTSTFPFTVTAKTPGNGSLKIDGSAGPINQQDASATPLDAQLSIQNLDLATTGFTDPKSGIGGTADLSAKVKSDGHQALSTGDVTVKNGKFMPAAQASGVPITVHYETTYDLAREVANITTGAINIGKASAQLTGTMDNHEASPVLNMKLLGSGMPIDELQAALPAFGVVLPPSAKLQGGTANANFAISGPLTGTVTTGTASIANAKLANFDLGSKLKGVGSLAGISSSNDTTIQQFSADLRNSSDGTEVKNLNVVVPTIGTITGQGTIAANNALDFHLVVKLTNGKSPAGMLTQVAGIGGAASNGIPVAVKGTTQNPQFIPDVGGLVKNMNPLGGKSSSGVGGVLGGLLGKKKPH